jgi:hypothetical protein
MDYIGVGSVMVVEHCFIECVEVVDKRYRVYGARHVDWV